MRKGWLLLILLGLFTTVQAGPVSKGAERPFVVVIDAGHGGTDPGAIGAKVQEKDLNLSVSLLAGQKIKDAFPEVDVLYTRTTDVFIPLQKRADFVNKNNANLFICVHTNSSPVPAAKGAETFVLGTDRLEKNLDVAMRENAVIKLEADYKTTYQGFDPNSVDSYIMFELMQNQYMDQSLNYASLLQQQFSGTLKRGDRGVRQAAFWVLLKSACPSVLVEMGFISNAEEERFMASDNGQKQIAAAICDAFSSFYKKVTELKVDTTVAVPEKQVQSQPVQPVQVQKAEVKEEAQVPSQTQQEQQQTPQQTQPSQQQTVQPEPHMTMYAVQIFASHEKLDEKDYRFGGLEGCKYIKIGEWYKYFYGETENREEAFRLQQKLNDKFPGCFVIKL